MEEDQKEQTMIARMAANADSEKKKKFMSGFSKATDDSPREEGMLAAMKRKMYGG